jgi:hypothetical protein
MWRPRAFLGGWPFKRASLLKHARLVDKVEVNSQGLLDVAAGINQQREEAERECQERVQELTALQT